MNEVLLINPNPNPWLKSNALNFSTPMGLHYIGSSLSSAGYKVRLVDTRLGTLKENEDIIRKASKTAELVGMTVMTAQIPESFRWIKHVREVNQTVPMVWGGIHPSLLPEQCLENKNIDIAVRGEGEETIVEVADALTKHAGSLKNIKGISYNQDGKIINNPERPLLDLNNLPELDYSLIDTEAYVPTSMPYYGNVRSLQVQTSRGCFGRCKFCINTIMPCYKQWRPLPMKIVEREMKNAIEGFKLDQVSMRDENFFTIPSHVDKVIQIIKPYDVQWFAQSRADSFKPNNLNVERLKELEKAGLVEIPVGCESGSNRVLKYIQKDITTDQILTAAVTMSKTNITGLYAFMTGFPTETKAEVMETVNLMKTIRKVHPRSFFPNLPMLRPYPGADIYKDCIDAGYKEPKTLQEWADTDFSENRGALSMDSYPWVEDPKFVFALTQYLSFGLQDFKASPSWLISAYMLICKTRLALNYFDNPYEYKAYVWCQDKLKKVMKNN